MNKLNYLSDYVAYRPGSSEKTIVCFSGIGAAPRKFYSTKALSESKHNLVFVNCPKNSWYLDGVPGLGQGFRNSAAELKRFLEEKNWFRESVYWGGSMGGFGAILYGALQNTANIVTCGAEWKLGISNSNSRKILCEIQKKSIAEYPDIPTIVNDSNSKLRVYWGDFAYHDFAAFLPNDFRENVNFLTLKEYGHPLPTMIHEKYGIGMFIDHHLKSDDLFPFPQSMKGDLLQRENLARDLHITANNGYEINSEHSVRKIQSLRESIELSHNQKVHVLFALGRHFTNTGEYLKALNSFDEAISMTPHNSYPFLNYYAAVAADMLGVADRPIEYLENAPACYLQTHFEYSEKACELLLKTKIRSRGLSEAVKFYDMIRAKEKNPALLATLEKILENKIHSSKTAKLTFDFDGLLKLDQNFTTLRTDKTLLITGIALPSNGLAISHGLVPLQEATIKEQTFNLPSPGLAKSHPEHKLSSHSRFKLIICPKANRNLKVELVSKYESNKIGSISIIFDI